MNEMQKGIIESCKRGGFKDALGFLEFTEVDGKISWFWHWGDSGKQKLTAICNFIERHPFNDLVLFLASQGKLASSRDEDLQRSISEHEQSQKDCTFYQKYIAEEKI